MPCRRRSKLENPIWRTTVLIMLSILAMISARSEFLSPERMSRCFNIVKVVISPNTDAVSQYAIGAWNIKAPCASPARMPWTPWPSSCASVITSLFDPR